MILSVSRRTDIPRFYFDWFLTRLHEGFVLVRNPMNHRQVSRVPLSPEVIDCIAFWTKDPAPMLPRLAQLAPYPWFLQFTLNPYGQDIEAGLPKKAQLLESFARLSDAIGPERVVWRYSPILLSERYTVAYHLEYFAKLARRLEGKTELCRISYLDIYPKIARRMAALGITDIPEMQKAALTRQLVEIGRAHGIRLGGCGNMNLAAAGLEPVGCIDAALVARVADAPILSGRDSGQRSDCYCMPSIDIGSYDTCLNGCVYCYANASPQSAVRKAAALDPGSPMLCDTPGSQDNITLRQVKSCVNLQTSLF